MTPVLLRELRLLRAGIGFGSASSCSSLLGPHETAAQAALYPLELRAMAGMLPGRRRDFTLGRIAGHRALQALGAKDGPILVHGRRPLFPAGLTGSISHSAGVAVAIAASTTRVRSLGIDLELAPPPSRAAHLVLGPEELRCVAQGKYSWPEAFCAKEAAFKALDPIVAGGVKTLRQLSLEPASTGLSVRLAKEPLVETLVTVRPVAGGVVAWVALV